MRNKCPQAPKAGSAPDVIGNAELHNGADRAERLEIRSELESAITQASREARIDIGAVAAEYARPR